MSRLTKFIYILLASITLCFATGGRVAAQGYYDDAYGDNQASYQEFYDELSPYGEWVNDPDYGYVWVPDAGSDFRPYYSNGYWVNSEYGNTWVSDYAWGWAPFHYGRWTYSSYYGWMWIPGNVWGPAWVTWRSGGGCYGWAPLGPGVSIDFALGGGYYVPDYWWIFTPQQYVLSPGFQHYCYGPRYNPTYVHQTTIINNTYVNNHHTYITGPRRPDLEHAIGRPVQVMNIGTIRRPAAAEVRGNTVNLYRPNIGESRPRANERPRSFQQIRQPISQGDGRQGNGGFNQNGMQPGNRVTTQPDRNGAGTGTPDAPRQERPRLDPVMQVPQQNQRQPDERPRNWNNARPAEPVQQQARPDINRNMEIQRQQDVQRQQDIQRQQSIQRQQEMQRQQDIQRQQMMQQQQVQRQQEAQRQQMMQQQQIQRQQEMQRQQDMQRQQQMQHQQEMQRQQENQRMQQPRPQPEMQRPQMQRMEQPRQAPAQAPAPVRTEGGRRR